MTPTRLKFTQGHLCSLAN